METLLSDVALPARDGTVQDRLNAAIYHNADIPRWYEIDSLDRPETMALLKNQPAFAGRDVLDVGVGTGRTTRFLGPLAGTYVGTDYSPPMVQFVRRTLPHVDVRLADMRDLSIFENERFDFVLGACNVLDAVGHADRLRTLAEFRRVLRPHGVLALSAHNRRFRSALAGPALPRSRNPVTQLRLLVSYFRRVRNHMRVRKYRASYPEYALLNDVGHEYAALHYYIDRDAQRTQLERAGFRLREVFDYSGRGLADGADDTESGSLFYVAERVD